MPKKKTIKINPILLVFVIAIVIVIIAIGFNIDSPFGKFIPPSVGETNKDGRYWDHWNKAPHASKQLPAGTEGPYDDKCFTPDSPVNMADGSYKRIDQIRQGDMVLVFNERTFQIEEAPVTRIQTKIHSNVYELLLENGKTLKPTANHPFYVEGKGWSAITQYQPLQTLEEGDYLYSWNRRSLEKVRITKITPIEGEFITYNFIDMKHGTFLVNDIVTHNSYAGHGNYPIGSLTMHFYCPPHCYHLTNPPKGYTKTTYFGPGWQHMNGDKYGQKTKIYDDYTYIKHADKGDIESKLIPSDWKHIAFGPYKTKWVPGNYVHLGTDTRWGLPSPPEEEETGKANKQ